MFVAAMSTSSLELGQRSSKKSGGVVELAARSVSLAKFRDRDNGSIGSADIKATWYFTSDDKFIARIDNAGVTWATCRGRECGRGTNRVSQFQQ